MNNNLGVSATENLKLEILKQREARKNIET